MNGMDSQHPESRSGTARPRLSSWPLFVVVPVSSPEKCNKTGDFLSLSLGRWPGMGHEWMRNKWLGKLSQFRNSFVLFVILIQENQEMAPRDLVSTSNGDCKFKHCRT